MKSYIIPRVFQDNPSGAEQIQVGDQVIKNGLIKTFLPNGGWLVSESDVALAGTNYCVDSANGSDGADGLTWETALATIGTALTYAVAGDRILVKGSFSEVVTIAAAQTGIAIIGVGTGPNQAVWTSDADTVSLTIEATDCLLLNLKFRPPAYSAGTPAAIQLGSSTNNTAAYTRISGCRFQGKTGSYIAIYAPVPTDNVVVVGNEFFYLNNITTVYGTAILGVQDGSYNAFSSWIIKNNLFVAPVQGIKLPGRHCQILGNHFEVNGLKADGTLGAVTGSAGSKKMINLSGNGSECNCNQVHGNWLGGTYSRTLYTQAYLTSDLDDWAGNYKISGLTTANPA